jgi:hypothetical protein
MSTSSQAVGQGRSFALESVPAWFWFGTGVYLLLLVLGSSLLSDSDTFWQIAVGKWILDHNSFPHVDIYSFTKAGAPWVSSSWLAQILYAEAYELGGWAGPVTLAAAAISITFALLAFILSRRIPAVYVIIVGLSALVLTIPHLLARPHVLAMPFMVAWVNGLLSASERREAPSFWLLPLLVVWANLHGGFVLGLALVAPFAFDGLWNAERPQRRPLVLRWTVFAAVALAASCATPYGWDSLLASQKILGLGELLHLISEWAPADFSRLSPLEACIFILLGGALYGGVKLSPPRIVLVLGLVYMAVSHVRNIEVFALLTPLVVLAPSSAQFQLEPDRFVKPIFPLASIAALLAMLGLSTWAFATYGNFSPSAGQLPAAAVSVLKERNAKRVLNDISFGGYLISRNVPVFIDGRAELYGEQFVMTFHRALELQNIVLLLDLLRDYDIDSVLLAPSTPATSFLDRLDGWQRAYADNTAVLYIRSVH